MRNNDQNRMTDEQEYQEYRDTVGQIFRDNRDILAFTRYGSPENEMSIFKGIPVDRLAAFRSAFRRAGIFYRIVYRGPRTRYGYSTLKSMATSFSAYQPQVECY